MGGRGGGGNGPRPQAHAHAHTHAYHDVIAMQTHTPIHPLTCPQHLLSITQLAYQGNMVQEVCESPPTFPVTIDGPEPFAQVSSVFVVQGNRGLREIPVAVHILPQQSDLLHTLGGEGGGGKVRRSLGGKGYYTK